MRSTGSMNMHAKCIPENAPQNNAFPQYACLTSAYQQMHLTNMHPRKCVPKNESQNNTFPKVHLKKAMPKGRTVQFSLGRVWSPAHLTTTPPPPHPVSTIYLYELQSIFPEEFIGHGFLITDYIRNQRDPMSTVNGPLVSLTLTVALL